MPRQQAVRKMAVPAQLSPWAPQAEQGEDVCNSSDMLQLCSLRCHQGLCMPLGGCQTLRCKQAWSATLRPADGPGACMPGPPYLGCPFVL